MDEWLGNLRELTVFAILGSSSELLYIVAHELNRAKTAFTFHYSLYMFTRVPIELKNKTTIF